MPMLCLCPGATAVYVSSPILILYNSKLHKYHAKLFFMISRLMPCLCPCLYPCL